jgi:lactate 2-monooxygenase
MGFSPPAAEYKRVNAIFCNSFYIGAIMRSLQRQRKIYLDGFAGIKPRTPVSYPGLEAKARQLLSPEAFAYLAGGAGSETTIDANRLALDQVKIHPRMLGGVQEVSMQLKWRAHTLPAPFMLAPVGVLELANREGDLAEARAAAAMNTPMIISSQASYPMEDIAKQLGSCPRLFQLYYSKSKELSKSFIRRAEAIDCSAIVVTLDTTLLGWRVRDLSLGYNPFIFGKGIAQYYSDPVFNALPDPAPDNTVNPPLTLSLVQNLIRLNNRIPGGFLSNMTSGKAMKTVRKFTTIFSNPAIHWDDISLIREWTTLPVYLKGILRPDDAMKAASLGVDGIIVSNHGGRQIDGSVPSVEALPPILAAAKGKMEIWVDSGIRSGSDVFKCLAMGATGVMIGRPYAMALACNGTEGVIDCLTNILSELELNMALSGCKNISEITAALITHPWKTTT